MRFSGVGHRVDLGALYLTLQARGHEVRVVADDPDSADVLRALLSFAEDLERGLAWIESAGSDGCVIVEGIGWGDLQDRLRKKGIAVLGGSALGDKLEGERSFAQIQLKELGLRIAASHHFDDFDHAIAFVRARPARYVLKYETSGFASTDPRAGLRHGPLRKRFCRRGRARYRARCVATDDRRRQECERRGRRLGRRLGA
jgi:phosphoribosylamine--glycine ligase